MCQNLIGLGTTPQLVRKPDRSIIQSVIQPVILSIAKNDKRIGYFDFDTPHSKMKASMKFSNSTPNK